MAIGLNVERKEEKKVDCHLGESANPGLPVYWAN